MCVDAATPQLITWQDLSYFSESTKRYSSQRLDLMNKDLNKFENIQKRKIQKSQKKNKSILNEFSPSPLPPSQRETSFEPLPQNKSTDSDPELEGIDVFLSTLDFGFVIDGDIRSTPRFYFDMLFPLSQSADKTETLFTQNRISAEGDGELTVNTGIGYRQLFFDNNLLAGINSFFDYRTNSHYRTGFGLELETKSLEANANYYNSFSGRRLKKKTFFKNEYEQAVDGFDLELGGAVPYLPWLKLFGGFTRYDFKHSNDIKTWKQRAEITASDYFIISLEAFDHKVEDTEMRLDTRIKFNFNTFNPKDFVEGFKSSDVAYPQADLRDRTLKRVERNYKVVLEKSSDTKNVLGNLSNIQLITRFPGTTCNSCLDVNSNGLVEAGDGFEIDFVLTNLGTETSSGISYSNATVSTGWSFVHNTFSSLADAPPGGTTRTNDVDDLDLDIPAGIANGTSFTITLNVTADGQSATISFGPFTVGSIADDQVFNIF